MEIFWRLVLGHLIGDFTLQTNHIAAWKRRSVPGMLVHCGIHPVIYSMLLWNYMGQVWVQLGRLSLTGWACVTIMFVAHFAEDQWRVWSVLKRSTPDNTFFYIWDQGVHYVVLFAMAPSIEGAAGKYGLVSYPAIAGVMHAGAGDPMSLSLWQRFLTVTQPEIWVFAAILFVLLTHFTTVSVYFIEKDYFGKDFPGDSEKYIGMAERLAVAACFLLPGLWWLGLVSAWIVFALALKFRGSSRHSWTSILLGNSAAVLCGALSRLIFYS